MVFLGRAFNIQMYRINGVIMGPHNPDFDFEILKRIKKEKVRRYKVSKLKEHFFYDLNHDLDKITGSTLGNLYNSLDKGLEEIDESGRLGNLLKSYVVSRTTNSIDTDCLRKEILEEFFSNNFHFKYANKEKDKICKYSHFADFINSYIPN